MNELKTGCRSWLWSIGVLARSPFYVIVLAAILAAWGVAAYEWLWLPESTAPVLLLALVWIIVLAAVVVAVVAATTAGLSAAAMGVEKRLRLRTSLRFGRTQYSWALVMVAIACLFAGTGASFFGWLNDHALNAASFLTLHLRKPVSYALVGEILWMLEALFWIALGAYLVWLLLVVSNAEWKRKKHLDGSVPVRPARITTLLTGLLGTIVFGGLAWLVATWHPLVKPGFWDYTQLAARSGVVLLLISLGWLFLMLSLARLGLHRVTDPAASPTPS
jgi:hypothetical protein